MNLSFHRMATVVTVALALLLGGCGSSETKDEVDTKPSAEEIAMKAIVDAKAALTTVQAEVEDATTDAEMLAAYRAVHAAAAAYVTALKANGGTAADVETATVAREHAMSMVTSLETKIADAKTKAEMDAQNKMNAAAMKVAEAINAHQLAKQPGVEFTTLTPMITRRAGPGEIKLNQTPAQAKDKTFAPSDANLDDNDWAGMAFTYTDPKGKAPMQSGTVFTGIDEGGDLAFSTYFDGTNHPLSTADGVVRLTSADIVTATADDFSGILPSGAPTAPDNKVERDFEGGTAVSGSFYGVPGEYRCASGAVCTVGVDVSGTVTVDGSLTFAPTIPSGKTLADVMVKNVDADKDYLHFGYWMQSVEQRDGSMRHDIRTFSGGAMPYNSGNGIGGATLGASTATYTGPAAGRYVKKSGFDSSGNNPTMVMDGTFTADAEFIATFGAGPSVPADDHFTVKGDISNFMDGSTDLGWTLELERSSSIESSSTFNGMTSGGGKKGVWDGMLYGDADTMYDHDYDTGTPGATGEVTYGPTGIAGQFNGHFTNGHVAGAFGATRD